MENHIGATRDQLFGDARHREIAGHRIDRKSRLVGFGGSNHVLQRHAADVALAETSVAQKPLGQLAADHAGRAENQNVQDPTPCSCSVGFCGEVEPVNASGKRVAAGPCVHSFTAPVIADT